MITVDEAQKIVLEHCKTIGHQIETVSFKQALHRVLAVDIKAKDPLPPFPGKMSFLQNLLVLLKQAVVCRLLSALLNWFWGLSVNLLSCSARSRDTSLRDFGFGTLSEKKPM